MKKLVMSIVFVLGATFAFGQELTKEELKQQKKEIKTLVNVAKDAEINIQADPVAAVNAMKQVTASPLVNNDPYVWYVSVSAKKAAIDAENRKEENADAKKSGPPSWLLQLPTTFNYDQLVALRKAKGASIEPKAVKHLIAVWKKRGLITEATGADGTVVYTKI